MRATSVHTRVQAQFYAFEGQGWSGDTSTEEGRAKFGHVIALNTSKSFGGASGTWSMTVKKPPSVSTAAYEQQWEDPEGIWVWIKFIVDGVTKDVMLGALDAVNHTVARSGEGTRAEVYTFSGRDFGRVFEHTPLFIQAHVPHQIARFGAMHKALIASVVGNTPSELARALVNAWIGNAEGADAPWRLPRGLGKGSFIELLDFGGLQAMSSEVNGLVSDLTLLSPQQDGTSLWDTLSRYANPHLNELWVDLAAPQGSANSAADPFAQGLASAASALPLPGVGKAEAAENLVPTIFLRERPFPRKGNRKAWNGVKTHDLTQSDVVQRQLARGGAPTRYNYWFLWPSGLGSSGQTAFISKAFAGTGLPGESNPIFDLTSIERHGLRRWENNTAFIPGAKTRSAAENKPKALLNDWITKVYDWNSPLPRLFSGSIKTSQVTPEIRIGQRVRELRGASGPQGSVSNSVKTSAPAGDAAMLLYVEGVEHSWSYPGTGTTTLTVTRGEYEGQSALDDIYKDAERGGILGGILK